MCDVLCCGRIKKFQINNTTLCVLTVLDEDYYKANPEYPSMCKIMVTSIN